MALPLFFLLCLVFVQAEEWSPCPVYTDPKIPPPPLLTADCRQLSVCLDWTKSGTNCSTIKLFVKRVNAVKGSTGQLWLLQGGPGTSKTDHHAYL